MDEIDTITSLLEAEFDPELLKVKDESHKHAGHAEVEDKSLTHLRITLVSDRFANLTRIERHRLIYSLLETELECRLHALALHLHTSVEFFKK